MATTTLPTAQECLTELGAALDSARVLLIKAMGHADRLVECAPRGTRTRALDAHQATNAATASIDDALSALVPVAAREALHRADMTPTYEDVH